LSTETAISERIAISRSAALDLLERIATLASCTDKPGEILRTFLSAAMEEVHQHLRPWLEGAGMQVSVDSAGNLRSLYKSELGEAPPVLLISSHLDTVPNAGAYDGVLGVLIGLALVEGLRGRRMPYAIEVIGFSDEEGTRFGVPFIGSRALAGTLSEERLLDSRDKSGITVREALAQYVEAHPEVTPSVFSQKTVGYLEFHIEQGPVLENRNLSLGVVQSVAGQTRCHLVFKGNSGHAGTSPMAMRRDALAAAAAWMTRCETIANEMDGLVATVGEISIEPGGVNVIPGVARCSLDVRHADDVVRNLAVENILSEAHAIAHARGLAVETHIYHTQPAVHLDSRMIAISEKAIRKAGFESIRMTSGAGHDAMVIAPYVPSAMIFLRSPGGISHHPDESVLTEDIEAAIHTGLCFLDEFATFVTKKESDPRA
jgi:allantoate deiminase